MQSRFLGRNSATGTVMVGVHALLWRTRRPIRHHQPEAQHQPFFIEGFGILIVIPAVKDEAIVEELYIAWLKLHFKAKIRPVGDCIQERQSFFFRSA